MIATIHNENSGGIPWFPYGRQRFQLAGSGSGTLIVGSSTFTRSHDFGSPTGVVAEDLSRGRFWRLVSGSWVQTPLLDEGGESERLASVACDVNADGVIVGAICEPVNAIPSPGETWRYRPAYWLPGTSGHTAHFFDQPQDDCLYLGPIGGVAYGVGPGEAPLAVGAAFTLCNSDLPEAFGATLADAPSSAPIVPIDRELFGCAEEFPESVRLSEALAVAADTGGDPVAVGFDTEYDPQLFETLVPPCIVPATLCDVYGQISVTARTWWLPAPPEANSAGPVIAQAADWRFRAFDGAAGPAAGELDAWSIAGGHSLDTTAIDTCHLHAAAYMGWLPDTEEYGTVSGQGLSFDVHGAIFDFGDPPNGEQEARIASAIGAICHAEAGNTAVTDVEFVAAGARYGGSEISYGVIWLGSRDGEGGWQWCGRNVNNFDVLWKQSLDLDVTAVHDILPSGIAVGIANLTGSGKKLVLLTSLCDINGDFKVDGADLGQLLGGWGTYTPGGTYRVGDLDRNGEVDGADLGQLLGAWSEGPVPVYMGCDAKLWVPISPIEVEEAARVAGFDGLQDLGDHMAGLDPADAANLGQIVSLAAQLLHQE